MLLTELEIRNFRGVEHLMLQLDDLCVLIGENNSGKTTVLDALRICLTRPLTRRAKVFEEYDYHLPDSDSEPSRAEPIEITLTFSERQKDEWPDEISQILSEAEQVDDQDLRSVRLRVKSSFDVATNDFVAQYDFLDLSGNPLVGAKSPRYLIGLQQLAPAFYLESLRDAAQEFRAKSRFWGPFVRALDFGEEEKAELEAALSELNEKVLEKHSAFETVKDRLEKTAEFLPLGETEPVSIEAVPSKVFDVLSRTQVNLTSKTGARIPIVRHGSGTQSLAVICLFDAFLHSQLKDGYGEHSEPLLALEEPEAHLHPSAIKAVIEMLQSVPGQKLISTHSGDLLAGIPLKNIRRLRRSGGKISVHEIDETAFAQEELDKLNYKVRTTRGGLLFSRCWLLVEGETEATLLPECARALGYDLYADGVSLIEFSQVGVEKFIKLADQLGIEWFVLVDNDKQGNDYEASAKSQIGTRKESDHICKLDHGNMEVFLCMEGFGEVYKTTVSKQKKSGVIAQKGTLEYWKQVVKAQKNNSKPQNSLLVAQKIIAGGSGMVPHLLVDVIEQARNLARSVG
ncbi:MAG: DUF2813 domain-containing protein [Candidatus Dadabacteria bacterium]|nr:DUF2813 domain-containing protein [Candidatus Dadabacteria bacterium]